jgi:hypothetical protein
MTVISIKSSSLLECGRFFIFVGTVFLPGPAETASCRDQVFVTSLDAETGFGRDGVLEGTGFWKGRGFGRDGVLVGPEFGRLVLYCRDGFFLGYTATDFCAETGFGELDFVLGSVLPFAAGTSLCGPVFVTDRSLQRRVFIKSFQRGLGFVATSFCSRDRFVRTALRAPVFAENGFRSRDWLMYWDRFVQLRLACVDRGFLSNHMAKVSTTPWQDLPTYDLH